MDYTQLQWSMNFNESYAIFVSIDTQNGRRYLTYTPRDFNKGVNGEYLGYGLGSNTMEGGWQTFTRNIAQDLIEMEPENALLRINTLMVRGSGEIDDISLLLSN